APIYHAALLMPLFFSHPRPTTEIYTLSLHDALPIFVREVDHAVHGTQHDVRPREIQGQRIGGTGDVVRQADDVEQHRQLEQVHRSEEHTSELQSPYDLVCRLLLEKKKNEKNIEIYKW